jgi:hypothetical protein
METYNMAGWIDLPDEVDAVESQVGVFGSVAPMLAGTGKGKIVCLHNNYKKAGSGFYYVNQGNLGSCVSAACSIIVNTLMVTEIANGEREALKGWTAIEPLYYGARVVIGQNKIRGDGAIVAHQITYINQYGTLLKQKYGQIDLTEYSVERCRKWGTGSGFPKTLEDISKEHTVSIFSRVKTYEEVRDSIANGYPVEVGSSYGFSSETDDEGFCRNNTTWQHALSIIAVDDSSNRKGCLISNSWPLSWLKIRKRKLDQPDGCFWVDAEVINKMVSNGDAWSIGGFNGYKKNIDTSVSW